MCPYGRDRKKLILVGIMKCRDYDCVISFKELLFANENVRERRG